MLHLAFAYEGLKNLGMYTENVDSFPLAFREGMSTPNRNRTLGDWGTNAPETWQWGGENAEEILMIFHAADEATLKEYMQTHLDKIAANGGVTLHHEMLGYLRPDHKEAFGFHDGISQPVIKGCGKKGPELDLIEPGEFLLGYKNEHGHFPLSPLVKKEQGDSSLLAKGARGSGKKDIGKNGTFMVFRQMQQHVDAFWKAMESHTMNPDGTVNEEAKMRLAAKCVGRWPSGASLVKFPDGDPGGSYENDDFGYADNDPDGMKCPFGSHLRRNNPRDQVRWYDKKQSLKVSNRLINAIHCAEVGDGGFWFSEKLTFPDERGWGTHIGYEREVGQPMDGDHDWYQSKKDALTLEWKEDHFEPNVSEFDFGEEDW